ncbi:3-carboxyethylcatechol 2,3-dioxygenase [Arthrobacter sp. ZGTC412]|uniref:3-carboxyethylcatechol 2,3-dioxygenase n=2 Tax=unclassified Arthrobacter TaxID=235627 RepID=UPI000CE3F7BF|nr:3-carboxyethylcatechol 2,3-dioxygenase [Arthrobacter sp. ZGTC412]
MTLALVSMSHSPLLEVTAPPEEIQRDVDAAFAVARQFVEDFNPDLVVSFAPDHYNGFFYELMPPFCIGYEAVSVGDYGSEEGPLNVPTAIAKDLAQAVIDADLDAAISLKMEIDHGAVQPLEVLFGSIAAKPVIPIFVNSVAPPFASMRRMRQLGTAVGNYLKTLDQKVLIIGSGGLSHDPPVPQIATATPEQKTMLLNGRHPTAAARNARQQRVIDTAAAFAKGEATIMDLNPEWDREFLTIITSGELEKLDTWTAAEMAATAGNSAHEVRNWVAAYNALRAAGEYTVTSEYYRPIPEFIAGFGVTTAVVK